MNIRVWTAMALTMGLLISPGAAAKDACSTAANTGSKVWKHAGPVVKGAVGKAGPFGATAATAAGLIEKGVKLWNKISGDDTWAKIGPRRLDFGKWNEGSVIGSTERLLLSGIPALNPVDVDFHKLDGDGKVKVVICRIPEKGKAKLVKSFEVGPGAKKGRVKSVRVQAAKGHVISIAIHGKSVSKKLKYKVRAKMDYSGAKNDDATTVTGERGDATRVTGDRNKGGVTGTR